MKHVFIINPISGKGHALEFIGEIENYFKINGGDYEIIKTERISHATEIAKEYCKKYQEVTIYSVGGDGTMKEILDGIQENAIMCVIPGGTGNDFYKSIDKRKSEIAQIVKDSIEGSIEYVDYGTLNGTSKFLNICSFGLDADINLYACNEAKKNTNIPNSMVYAYSALKVGLHPSTYHMKGIVDSREIEDEILLFAISNGKFYGGMFMPAPMADIQDGNLDVCYFKNKMTLLRIVHLILKYTKGKHLQEKECEFFNAKRIELSFDRTISYQIDGENGTLDHCVIEVHPKAMRLKVPKGRIINK